METVHCLINHMICVCVCVCVGSVLGGSEGGEWVSVAGERAPEPAEAAGEGEWRRSHHTMWQFILWCSSL